jgi:hypothetical protein
MVMSNDTTTDRIDGDANPRKQGQSLQEEPNCWQAQPPNSELNVRPTRSISIWITISVRAAL